MNKILKYTGYLIFIITILLTLLFSVKNEIFNVKILLLYISLIILLIINIRDIKIKREYNNRYNILYISVMILTSFILFRSMFDTNIISNSKYYSDMINLITQNSKLILGYGEYGGALYLSQNVYYLLVLYLCLIIYHKIDTKNTLKHKSKYSISSIICLIISIILLLEILSLLPINHFPLLLFTLNIILLVVEITSLIKNNGIKKEWPIYLSFIFNLFIFIFIIVEIIS